MCSSVAVSVSQAKLRLPQARSRSRSSFSFAVSCPSSSLSLRQSTSKALVACALATSNSRVANGEHLKSTSSSPPPSKTKSSRKQRDLSFPSETEGKLLLGGSHNIVFRPQFASFHLLNYGFYAPLSDLDLLAPKLRALLPPSPSPSTSPLITPTDVPPHLLHQFHAFSLSQLRHHPDLLPTFHAHSRLSFRLHLLPWHPRDNKVLRSYALYAHNFTARLYAFLSAQLTDPLLRSFASLFKDPNIPSSIIEISKEPGYLLRLSIDGKEVAQTQSQVVWNLMWDLLWNSLSYNAKQGIRAKLTSRVKTT